MTPKRDLTFVKDTVNGFIEIMKTDKLTGEIDKREDMEDYQSCPTNKGRRGNKRAQSSNQGLGKLF